MTLTSIRTTVYGLLQQTEANTLTSLDGLLLYAFNQAVIDAQNRHDFKLSVAEAYLSVDPTLGANWMLDGVETEEMIGATEITQGVEKIDTPTDFGGSSDWAFLTPDRWVQEVALEQGKRYKIVLKVNEFVSYGVNFEVAINTQHFQLTFVSSGGGLNTYEGEFTATQIATIFWLKGLDGFWWNETDPAIEPSVYEISFSVKEQIVTASEDIVGVKFKQLQYIELKSDENFFTVFTTQHEGQYLHDTRNFLRSQNDIALGRNNLRVKGPKVFVTGSEEDQILRVTGIRVLPEFLSFEDTNFIVENGSSYLLWYATWFLNKRLQVFQVKQEGFLPEPGREKEAAFSELTLWDTYLTSGGDTNGLLANFMQ